MSDWRPGRTMVLCSWDAEEYGLIGSTEFVEVSMRSLHAHVVVVSRNQQCVRLYSFSSFVASNLSNLENKKVHLVHK